MTTSWQRTLRAVKRLTARRGEQTVQTNKSIDSPHSDNVKGAAIVAEPAHLLDGQGAGDVDVEGVDSPEKPMSPPLAETHAPAGSVELTVPSSVGPFVTWAAPGHFYSPVPDLVEVEREAERLFAPRTALEGIDLCEPAQLANFRELARLAREAPIPSSPNATARYGTDNLNYGVGDASMLQAMLRHLRPRRYLEVGSGWSTALALDTSEQFLEGSMSVTAIEPYPELLSSCLRAGDPVEIIAQPVQSVPLERFRELEANDVLFIDSSHVLKAASDVHFLFTSVLPVLAPGVYVHVHDMFWPFEYLRHWIEEGRAWNECYLVHAFLLFNDTYEIVLFNHYLAQCHRDVIATELPAMLENTGGALWLRRVR
jgi:hypothetical protein